MAEDGFYAHDLRWLLEVGQRLQAEYDAVVAATPMPERMAAMLKQIESATDAPRLYAIDQVRSTP